MTDRWQPPDLTGRVAVVTGASRGGGRGIAEVLGSCGATVYVTGRSSRRAGRTRGLPGTIEATASRVSARGGRGIPVRVDHSDARQVKRLFARVRREAGRLDLLVSNAWGGYERHPDGLPAGPFWEQSLEDWTGMFDAGLKAAYLSAYFGAPLMLPRHRGLIVQTLAWDRGKFLGHFLYDLAKQAVRRLVYDLALELRPRGIAAVALAPGFMRTEIVLAAHRRHPFDLRVTESTEYIGRAVASLAADRAVLARSGRLLAVGDLARSYGFTDVDGRRVRPFRIPAHHLLD